MPATLTLMSSMGLGTGLTRTSPSLRLSLAADGDGLPHGGSALQFVPGEAAAFHRALEGLYQHDGKQLAIGEALQPDVSQQQEIAFPSGLLPLQGKGNGRGDEVNQHEEREVHHQAMEACRVR